jgi:hypothetical protein
LVTFPRIIAHYTTHANTSLSFSTLVSLFLCFSPSLSPYPAPLLQEKLLGLMSLPTKDKYEELKMKRKQEQEKRLAQERLVRRLLIV